jgi:hypothetical protein
MAKYSHVFSIAFTVETDAGGESVATDELWAGIHAQLVMPYGEIIEACGLLEDTVELC